jgi:hypothetical protein
MFGPFATSTGLAAAGAAPGQPIEMGGIRAIDGLLCVLSWPPIDGPPVGHDVSDFTVADGELVAATVDTSGRRVCAVWHTAG